MADSKQSDREVFESIPWEELRDLGDTSQRRRIWYLVAGAVVVAVLIFSVVRTFSAPHPQLATVPGTTPPSGEDLPPPILEGAPPTLPSPDPFTAPPAMAEADLRAAGGAWEQQETEDLTRWQAASHSEWFVLDFFTLDGSDRRAGLNRWLDSADASVESDALSYVEWVRTLQAEHLADGRWRTVVALRRLVSTDGAVYSRIPTQAVEVVVDLGTGTPTIVDLPRFVPLPPANAGPWWTGNPSEMPPVAVVRAARDVMNQGEAGDLGGEPTVTRTAEAWRVQWAVIDPAGIWWPVSVWIGAEGTPVPAGG
ncbi:MAG: hypothetical protein J4G00_01805 [Actinomycetia bacterium]|nr:hypothetical protein [Actinomycetes bacterium]